jgi:hypothetical protein
MNLTETLHARTDSYARKQGAFILGASAIYLSTPAMVWEFVRSLQGRTFRVIYRAETGNVGDWIGRQGVHNSKQDGTVAGTGHAMASADRLTLSFWTQAYGRKVNTGAGKGYRTLRADRILAIRVDGADFITKTGMLALAEG